MNHLTQVVTLSVIDIETQKEVERRIIESPSVFYQEIETNRWLNKGYSVERIVKEESGTNLSVTIYLRVKEVLVFPNEFKRAGDKVDAKLDLTWPQGVDQKDLNTTYERIISFTYEDGRKVFEPVLDQIKLTRTALVNFVTGEISYLPWKSSTGYMAFPDVSVPALPGYTTDKDLVKGVEVLKLKTEKLESNVVYKRQKHLITIQVVEEGTDTILREEEFEGKTGDAIRYPIQDLITRFVAKGYELVHNDLDTTQFIQVDGPRNFQMIMKQRVVDLDQQENFPEVGKAVYPEIKGSLKWPKGTGEEYLHKVVRRSIHYTYEDGSVALPSVEQESHFYRSARVNLVTGKVIYGPWQGETMDFPAVEAPKISGFLAKPRMVPQLSQLSPSRDNRVETIVYTKIIQKIVIEFVEEDDQVLEKIQLVGRSGDPIHFRPDEKIETFASRGYELVSSDFPDNGIFGSTDGEVVTYSIRLKARTLLVTADHPQVAGTPVEKSGENGPFWPKGVEEDDLLRKVERQVHFRYEDDSEVAPSKSDYLIFRRSAKVNLVTGKVSYLDWDPAQQVFPAVELPQIDGCSTDRAQIEETTVTPASAQQEITVYYNKDEKPLKLRIYHDTKGTVLREKVTYSRETEDLTKELEELLLPLFESGYTLTKRQKEQPYDRKGMEISLRVVPVVETVTADEPHRAFSPVTGYPRLNWPSGLERDQLTKVLKRTIRYVYRGESEPFKEEVQECVLKRAAKVVLATGAVTYGKWQTTTDGFSEVVSPKVDGYQADQEVVPKRTFSFVRSDEVLNVYYWPVAGKVTIEYRTDDNVLETDSLVGALGETINYRLLTFPGYEVVNSTVPKSLRFGTESQKYQVILEPKKLLVDYNHPLPAHQFQIIDGKSISYPRGLELEDLTYVNQRIIQFLSDTGEVLKDGITQESRVSRKASLNVATLEVEYESWQSDAGFPAVISPLIQGYETTQQLIPELVPEVDGQRQIIRETIYYTPRPFRFYVRVVMGDQLLEELTLIVRAGELPTYSLDQLVDGYQKQGYELVETQVIREEEYERFVDLVLKAKEVVISPDMIRNHFAEFDKELAHFLEKIPALRLHQVERSIKRTIRYLSTDRTELAPALINQVIFERQARVNLVTSTVHFEDWMSSYPLFDATVSPLVPGYQTDQEFMTSIEVKSPDVSDIVEEVIYSKADASVVVDSPESSKKMPRSKVVPLRKEDKMIENNPQPATVAPEQVIDETSSTPTKQLQETPKLSFWQRFKNRFFGDGE